MSSTSRAVSDRRAWVSPAEAAEYVGVTERTVRAWIARGNLNASRPRGSRLVRIARSDLEALMQPIATTGAGA